MTDPAYDAWSRRHDGLDPQASGWVRGWVRLTDRIAAPLADRGVPADAVTVAGVAVTAAVPLLASARGAWPAVAVPVAVVAGVLDGVDGAVASRSGTVSRRGRTVDATADRVADVLLARVPVALGAPGWTGHALGGAALLHEGARALARLRGMDGPGRVTVSERPTRVIIPCVACVVVGAEHVARRAGVSALPAVDRRSIASAAALAGLGLATAGLAQLVSALPR